MGDFNHAMRKLVDGIVSSAENRHVQISEMRSDTLNFLERFRLERQDLSNALREKFSSDNKARKEATRQFVNDIRFLMDGLKSDIQDSADALREKLSSDNKACKEATRQFVNDIESFMNDLEADVQDSANALRKRISSEERTRRKATKRFMDDLGSDLKDAATVLRENLSSERTAHREATGQFIDNLASDYREAHKIWTEMPRNRMERTAHRTGVKLMPEKKPEGKTMPLLEDQVLEVVTKHPGGIRLVGVGNELGIDWRGLIGIVKAFVDEGKIEKIDSLYYPKN